MGGYHYTDLIMQARLSTRRFIVVVIVAAATDAVEFGVAAQNGCLLCVVSADAVQVGCVRLDVVVDYIHQ